MSRIKLRKAVKQRVLITWNGKEKVVKHVARPVLYASKCDACGIIYSLSVWCNDSPAPGQWRATMENVSGGNGLTLDVCSFACAHALTIGGWRNTARAKEDGFADQSDASPGRVIVNITPGTFQSEDELVKAWEDTALREPDIQPGFRVSMRIGEGLTADAGAGLPRRTL